MTYKKGKILLAGICILFVGFVTSLIASRNYSTKESLASDSEVLRTKSAVHFDGQDFKVHWKTSDELYNPYQLKLFNDLLFVRDSDGTAPFTMYDTLGHFQGQFGGWGEGPGEFGKQPRLIGQFDSTALAASDDMRRRVMRFDLKEHAFTGQMQVPASGGPPALDDSLLIVRTSHTKHFMEGMLIDPQGLMPIEGARRPFGTYDELPEVAPAKRNYLLKQGPILLEPDGHLYLALAYGGLLMSFRRDGTLRFKTSEPHDIPLPDFSADDIPLPDVTAASPPSNIYPTVFIGLSVDDRWVYALYSGKRYTAEVDITALEQGTRVYAYDKNTGDLAFSFDLPVPARDFAVTPNAIYVLSADPEVSLLKLSRPF